MFKKSQCFKFVCFILLLWRFFYKQNSDLTVSTHIIKDPQIPYSFDNYKVVNISDLHNKTFGKNNIKLLDKIDELNPNIIVVTGDLINAYHPDRSLALNFIKKASKIAPLFYISGNHEVRLVNYELFKTKLINAGATVLSNDKIVIRQKEHSINLIGLDDPNFYPIENRYAIFNFIFDEILDSVNPNDFTILLSHRPELMDIYASKPLNLILSGHAHGGQFRFPIIGGIFAPNQGFLPKYSSGKYSKLNTTMIVSRGLGPSSFPLRLNNKPDLVEVVLKVTKNR